MSIEKLNAVEALLQAANHKATNLLISTSLIVTGQVTKEAAKIPEYATLSDFGWLGIGAPTWLQIIGGVWIILQILNFCGFFRGIAWLYKKLKGDA